jgi:polysaccharide pyruvyl transferase WcaK-like protein
MKKIRILTYHHVTNNGAVLQAYSLCNALEKKNNDYNVKILDYKSREVELGELLKIFKLYRKDPFFNFSRYFKFKKFIEKNLRLDKSVHGFQGYNKIIEFLNSQNYDMLVVGSDVIWKIAERSLLPKFPNVYWLSNQISAPKIAYAASAYQSDVNLVNKYKGAIRDCLNAFNLIGVRDEFTMNLVKKCDINSDIPVLKIQDPTFLYGIKKTNVDRILTNSGIDLDKPILGILIYGNDKFSKSIRDYFKSKGYQIIALSMYNLYADLNLGHLLDPFEWAEIFKYLTFCITDRFHGTIFCLKNKTPFTCIEPRPLKSTNESKLYSLLNDFNMLECYSDLYSKNFDINEFFDKCSELLNVWDDQYKNKIEGKLKEMKNTNYNFIDQMGELENV